MVGNSISHNGSEIKFHFSAPWTKKSLRNIGLAQIPGITTGTVETQNVCPGLLVWTEGGLELDRVIQSNMSSSL